MMMHTMNEMMNGGMGLMMSGMFLSMALWILLLAVLTWGLLTWLNRGWGRLQPMPDTAQSPYSYHSYEQGYHPTHITAMSKAITPLNQCQEALGKVSDMTALRSQSRSLTNHLCCIYKSRRCHRSPDALRVEQRTLETPAMGDK